MGEHWQEFRYVRHNPDLIPRFQTLEKKISAQPVYYIPKSHVPSIEPRLQNGDVICIASTWPGTFTSHVGLAYRDPEGVLHLLHATSIQTERRVVIGPRLSDYLFAHPKTAGILVARPLDLPPPAQVQKKTEQEKSARGPADSSRRDGS
ncbi:MAG: N-acetylmuramoyl-L-alanine amidase-like domain-containing protein [Candidatus Methylacidiphilaceae bacterium]